MNELQFDPREEVGYIGGLAQGLLERLLGVGIEPVLIVTLQRELDVKTIERYGARTPEEGAEPDIECDQHPKGSLPQFPFHGMTSIRFPTMSADILCHPDTDAGHGPARLWRRHAREKDDR